MSQSLLCPYCGMIGYHMWGGAGACPGLTNPNPPIVLTGSTAFVVEVAALKALCGRAADALALAILSRHSQAEIQDYSYLIAELRKAAE